MQSLSSPWAETFEEFARSIRKRAIVVAPFITEQPLERLAYQLDTNNLPQITILTNLAVDSLLQGSVNGQAIADFCKAVPTTTVRHLPGLHAKTYVADEHTAIITSGNLTYNSLHQNYEYGIQQPRDGEGNRLRPSRIWRSGSTSFSSRIRAHSRCVWST